ncbi:MAG TPA: tetratricopeptide repeat protein [Thermoanaerobaculia bacterium]|nr:tetratricopeptide repeat protein [Thermoanaerobaculia bacterium]
MAVNRDQVLQSAEKLLSRGKLDGALKEYLRVLEDNPKDISTLNKVGDLYVRMNRPSESIPYFTRIADFYSKDGFFLKAIAIFKKINKIDPAQLEVYDKLADLYHKQGLVQDARSQYQVLADHYQKNNRLKEAIAVYKKMASIDPSDLRIQVRLADIYRAAHEKNEAVMQYGLIGNMLLKRGAHDEAAQVFQKALELSPHDVETQRNLVRSLLAQKNTDAAMAVLKAAPRTPESLSLFAEAQLEMGQRAEAIRTAEQALALDADAEAPRLFLFRLRMQEMALDKAVAAVAPLIDAAVGRREFGRASEYLEPVVAADPGHAPALEKLLTVYEAEGNRPGLGRTRVALGAAADRRRDIPAAAEQYRLAAEADPGNVAAATWLAGQAAAPPIGSAAAVPSAAPASPAAPAASATPSAPAPAAATAAAPPPPAADPEYQELIIDLEDSASVHAPQPKVPGIDLDEEPAAPATASATPEATREGAAGTEPPEAAPAGTAEEQQLETLIVEAEVFAKYGLADKAIDRLYSLAQRRPDLFKVRERLIELLAETENPGLAREVASLAEAYTAAGRTGDAERIRAMASGAPRGGRSPHSASAASPPAEVVFEEFEIGQPAAPPAEAPRAYAGSESIDLGDAELSGPPPTFQGLTTPEPQAPQDTEFVSYEQLGNLLEDEMHRAEDAPPAAPAVPDVPAVDEANLFADEQKFFNLAEELEKELSDEAIAAESGSELSAPQGEVSLEEIFREFKKGVEQQLSAEDYETHYNLGIAYKEMGLVDEAIGEFQLASKDPQRAIECCSMLGHCFLEKGMPQLAIKWFRKGLETPHIQEAATAGMLYDLASVYQDTGDTELAYKTFQEVYGLNANYRDVVRRVKDLEAVRKNS